MLSFLNPESKFMLAMSRIGDLLLLNLMFLISCVPIFTIGAASTAMYTLCFRFDTDREQGLIKSYLIAFRDNFKQATVIWLILLLCGVTACINAYIFYVMSGVIPFLYVLFLLLLVLVIFIGSYAFPLLSQFDNTNKATLKNALIFSGLFPPVHPHRRNQCPPLRSDDPEFLSVPACRIPLGGTLLRSCRLSQ